MKRKLFRFLFWLKNKLHKPQYQLTARGLYICHYLIEKYFNEERDDYNEVYEEFVDKKLERIESLHFFDRFHAPDGSPAELTSADKRGFAAQMVVAKILYSCNDYNREHVYAYIKDEHLLELIKHCIEEGMVF